MVARRRRDRARVGPLRLVESLPLRARNANDAAAGADGGGVRAAAMGVRPLDLCLRRARPDRLCLFRSRARPTGGAGPDQRNAIPARPAVHGLRLGARRWRPRGASRRRAESSRQHRHARPRDRPARGPQESDRPARSRGAAHCRLSHQGRERGIPDHGRQHRLRSVLPARQSRLCAAGGGAAAVAGEGPRRADLGGIEHAQSGHSILDQPRHRGAGRELRRLDRLRPRLPRPPAADLGRGRRRRLRQRRRASWPSRDASTASAASSAAAAPAAIPRWRR